MYSVAEQKNGWTSFSDPKTKAPSHLIGVAAGAILIIGVLIAYFTSADVRSLAGSVVTQLKTSQLTVGQGILYIGLPLMTVGAIASFAIRLLLKTQERKQLDFYDITNEGRSKEIFKTIAKLFYGMRASRQTIYAVALGAVIALGIILASNGPLLSQQISLGKALAAATGFTAGFYLLLHAILFLEKRMAVDDRLLALKEAQRKYYDEDT